MAEIKESDISITISFKLNEQKAIPQLRAWIARGLWYGLKKFERDFELLVMTPLILGSPGWKSLEQYGSWKWINSPAGFGQLGFSDRGEPLKLLILLMQSYEVKVSGKPGTGGRFDLRLNMKFFDTDKIRANTIHPHAGDLGLPGDRSWFDWVLKGRALTEPANFVKTGPTQGSRSSKIAGSQAGLMKDKGTGLWSVPPKYRLDLVKLIEDNEDKIIHVLQDTVINEMIRYL